MRFVSQNVASRLQQCLIPFQQSAPYNEETTTMCDHVIPVAPGFAPTVGKSVAEQNADRDHTNQ